MKNILKVVFVIIGTLVGAGFASGKEIYSFFFVYGKVGIFGIFLSSAITGYIINKVFKVCSSNNIKTYFDFCKLITKNKDNNRSTVLLNNIVNIFLIITFFTMISGFSSFLNQEFGVKRLIGSLFIIAICYWVFLKSVNGLIKISNYLVPIIIFLIVIISMKNMSFYINLSTFFNFNISLVDNSKLLIGIVKSVLYASYNCIILIPVLIPLTEKINGERNTFILSWLCSFLLLGLSFSIYNLLLQGNKEIFLLEMPIIAIIRQYNHFFTIAYIAMIGISIFTSAVSAGCGFLNNCSLSDNDYKRNVIMISIAAVIVAQIRFSTFVNLLYPALGLVGLLEIILIILKKEN